MHDRLLHGPAADEMLLDNAGQQIAIEAPIPDPLRMHDHQRTLIAGEKTAAPRAHHPGGPGGQATFALHQLAEMLVKRQGRTMRASCAHAEEDLKGVLWDVGPAGLAHAGRDGADLRAITG